METHMTIDTPTDPAAEAKKERARAALAKAREAKAQKKRELTFQSEDQDALRKKRAELLEELAKLPEPEPPVNVAPGSLVKDGLGVDKVPWTPAVLRDYCNRGVSVDGVPFSWRTLFGDGKIMSVSWNGIVYWLWPDRENKIPSVHYAVYMQALEDRRREASRWRGPGAPNPSDLDGFNSAEAHS